MAQTSLPLATYEIRWFFDGSVEQHPALQHWFELATPFERCQKIGPPQWQPRENDQPDVYLLLPDGEDMGIKWREGQLQIKGRVSELGTRSFCGRHQGRAERWVKWSYANLPPSYQRLLLEGEILGLKTVAVQKVRALRKLRLDTLTGKVQEVAAQTFVQRGLGFELVDLQVAGKPYCSLAVEAFPDESVIDAAATQAAETFLDSLTDFSLTAADSLSYPAWLARLPEASLKVDYPFHDVSYQRKRTDPAYTGWNKGTEAIEELSLTWEPLRQKQSFPQRGRLLEVGCGAGNLSLYFAKAGYEVTGVDIAPTAIQWAKENAAKAGVTAEFILGDVLTLAYLADESFDLVIDGYCFHCIIGRDRARFLQAIHRVLKPGGRLVICTMSNQVPNTPFFQERFDPDNRCLMYDGIATRYIGDSNSILQEVLAANFRILAVEVVPSRDNYETDLDTLQMIVAKS